MYLPTDSLLQNNSSGSKKSQYLRLTIFKSKLFCYFDYLTVLRGNIDQTLVNALHAPLNFEIGGLDCCIATEYISHIHCIHMLHLFCNALVHVIYSKVSGQYSYTCTIDQFKTIFIYWTFSIVKCPGFFVGILIYAYM